MSTTIAPIPAIGTIASQPRREAIYDTDVLAIANVATASPVLKLFSNYSSFANAPAASAGATLTKQFGRDTNLSGVGGLPAATMMYWFSWRTKLRTLDGNLNTANGATVSELINRTREMIYTQFTLAQSTYITTQGDEVPSGTGPQYINSNMVSNVAAGSGAMGNVVVSLPSGVPTRMNGKDVTVGKKPKVINPLEQFNVIVSAPQLIITFPLAYNLYVTSVLEGILLRGVTG